MIPDNIEKLREGWLDFNTFKNIYLKEEVSEFPNKVIEVIPAPLVSVMIITYQHGKYIKEAIESVLMQETDFPFEIIIGDDASSDGTAEVCLQYAEKHPEKIRYFQHSRKNNIKIAGRPSHLFQYAYNAFNFRGKYFAILSGDDYWTDSEKLQKQFNFMELNPNIAYCYHDWKYFYENKNQFSEIQEKDMVQTIFGVNVLHRLPLNFINSINEDIYTKFLLRIKGASSKLRNIKPSVYRMTNENLWGDIESIEKHNNRIRTYKNILQTFEKTRFEDIARERLYTLIMKKHYFLNPNRFKMISPLLKELSGNKLLLTFFRKKLFRK